MAREMVVKSCPLHGAVAIKQGDSWTGNQSDICEQIRFTEDGGERCNQPLVEQTVGGDTE